MKKNVNQIFFYALIVSVIFLNTSCSFKGKNYNRSTEGNFPVYGNWCGPNHPQNIDDKPIPIDDLDRACMRHDICYEERGYFSCSCDSELLKTITQNKYKFSSSKQALIANEIILYFDWSPFCKGNPVEKGLARRLFHPEERSGNFAIDFLKFGGLIIYHGAKCTLGLTLLPINTEKANEILEDCH